MIEHHATASHRMTREQAIMHCLMIRAELEKIHSLMDQAIKRCEEKDMLDAYGEG